GCRPPAGRGAPGVCRRRVPAPGALTRQGRPRSSGSAEDAAEGETDPLGADVGFAGNAVAKVSLAGAAHEEESAVAEIEDTARPVALPAGHQHQTPRGAE